jgi:hypothetical protein
MDSSDAAGGAAGGFIILIYILLIILIIASWWKIFSKAGKPGWAAIIPIYNIIVMLDIVDKPLWWIILFFIPIVNYIISLIVFIELAKCFGKGAGFGVGLWLLGIIFFPILAFGDAQYEGPSSPSAV